MRWIALSMFCLFVLMLRPVQAGHSSPKIIFRVYVQTSGQGMPDTEARPLPIPPNNETIMVRTLPELTENDLVDVRADSSGYVHFHFNHSGTVALNAVTAQNQGRILAITINTFVVAAPIIDEQLDNGELVMAHPLDPQVIQMLEQVAQHNLKEAARR